MKKIIIIFTIFLLGLFVFYIIGINSIWGFTEKTILFHDLDESVQEELFECFDFNPVTSYTIFKITNTEYKNGVRNIKVCIITDDPKQFIDSNYSFFENLYEVNPSEFVTGESGYYIKDREVDIGLLIYGTEEGDAKKLNNVKEHLSSIFE